MKSLIRKFLVPSLLIASAGTAHASCSSYLSYYNFYLNDPLYGPSHPYTIQYYNYALEQGCFGTPGNLGQSVVQGTSITQVTSIFNAISSRSASGQGPSPLSTSQVEGISGAAAGGGVSKWNAWANGANATQRYSGGGALGTHFESDTMNLVLGSDYQIAPAVALGVSAAFDTGDTRLFKTGPSITTTGYAIAPYASWQINNLWSLDGTLGFGEGESKAGGGTTVTDSRRYFSGLNLGYTRWSGDWQFAGKASVLNATDKQGDSRTNGVVNANTGTKNKLTQFRFGGQVAYWANGVMPYVGLAWSQDSNRTEQINNPWDKSALVFTAGVNFVSIKDNVTGGVVFTNEFGRNNSANYSLMGNINLRF